MGPNDRPPAHVNFPPPWGCCQVGNSHHTRLGLLRSRAAEARERGRSLNPPQPPPPSKQHTHSAFVAQTQPPPPAWVGKDSAPLASSGGHTPATAMLSALDVCMCLCLRMCANGCVGVRVGVGVGAWSHWSVWV